MIMGRGSECGGGMPGKNLILATRKAANPGRARLPDWRHVCLAVLPSVIIAVLASLNLWLGPLGFLPLLSLGPALASISLRPALTAVTGLVALAVGIPLIFREHLLHSPRTVTTLCAIAGVTVASVGASAVRTRRERELANIRAIAEAAQQILLRPVPARLTPVDIAVRYVSAAAPARIGGDLYEAVAIAGGMRLILGDVLGKGLPAARTAAVVLGAFRDAACDAPDLASISRRIEASMQRQQTEEEFVTAVLAQVSGDGSHVVILNCGHPQPLLVREGTATDAVSPRAGLPLGLSSLAAEAREPSVIPFGPSDRLLFYTDGISEARDSRGRFYPIGQRAAALLNGPDLGACLDRLMADVRGYVGHALHDDAALLLISRCRSALPPG